MSYNPLTVAKKRGWADDPEGGRTSINQKRGLPCRANFAWNLAERCDLQQSWETGSRKLQSLAVAHGRTPGGIASELKRLGFDPLYTLDLAKSLREVMPEMTAYNCRCTTAPISTQELTAMNMTTNRLMTLLAIHRGTLSNELALGTQGTDIAALVNAKLVSQQGTSAYNLSLTSAGLQLVKQALAFTSAGSVGVDANAMTEVSDESFYLVANGKLTLDESRLAQGPRVVHSDEKSAEQEAIRLAGENRDQAFYVLRTVSVHKTRAPVASKRL